MKRRILSMFTALAVVIAMLAATVVPATSGEGYGLIP